MNMEQILNRPFYSIKELNNLGFTNYKIRKLIDENRLEKINKKYYENLEYEEIIDDFNYIPLVIENGIICSLSAAVYYGYTTYRPNSVDVAIPIHKNVYKLPDYPSIQLHYMTEKRLNTGVVELSNDIGSFKIFNKERTVCDILLNKTKIDSENVKNVITGYLNDDERDMNALSIMAKELGCLNQLQIYLEVLL